VKAKGKAGHFYWPFISRKGRERSLKKKLLLRLFKKKENDHHLKKSDSIPDLVTKGKKKKELTGPSEWEKKPLPQDGLEKKADSKRKKEAG